MCRIQGLVRDRLEAAVQHTVLRHGQVSGSNMHNNIRTNTLKSVDVKHILPWHNMLTLLTPDYLSLTTVILAADHQHAGWWDGDEMASSPKHLVKCYKISNKKCFGDISDSPSLSFYSHKFHVK